jgi:DNA ligase-1
VIVKDPHARYEAAGADRPGSRSSRAHVGPRRAGVERGSGRRQGLLSNIHLGARDPETGGFVMLGKTFKE